MDIKTDEVEGNKNLLVYRNDRNTNHVYLKEVLIKPITGRVHPGVSIIWLRPLKTWLLMMGLFIALKMIIAWYTLSAVSLTESDQNVDLTAPVVVKHDLYVIGKFFGDQCNI